MARIETVLKVVALAVGLIAVLMYGVLVVAYQHFYGILGVPIEEVGRSRLDLLPEVLSAPILIMATDMWAQLALWLVIAGGGTVLVFSEVQRLRRETNILADRLPPWAARGRRMFRRLRVRRIASGLVYTLACALLISGTVGTFRLAQTAWSLGSSFGRDVRTEGRSVTGIFKHQEELELLLIDIQALPARVDWYGTSNRPTALVANPGCLMYLGQNNGRIVLYDVRAQAVIRYDAADAVLTVLPNTQKDQVSAHCRRP